jgi:hypothetical protein
VRKGTTTVIAVGAALVVAALAARACGGGDTKTPVSTANSAKPEARPRASASSRRAAKPPPPPTGSAILAPARDAAAPDGKVVFFSPWGGSHKDQLGRERPQEGNPMGPMSLAHDAKGNVYVLDQVNGRVVRRGPDGALEQTSEVKLRAAQDVAVGKDGSMAVLDRLGDKAIALYEPSGALRAQLPLEGEGVTETGYVTGVFVDGSDVYVEREHGPLVKIGDVNGTPAEPRTEIPGRPSRDGLSFLNAGLTDAMAGRAYVSSIERATGEHRFTRELRLKSEIRGILLLDSDKTGTIYFAVELHEEPSTDWVLLQCLEPLKGVPVGSAILPVNTLPEETFRDLTVLDDGGVIYALRSSDGVTYRRYDCGG